MKPSAAEDRCIPDVDASQESARANNGDQEVENAPRPERPNDAGPTLPIDAGEMPTMDAGPVDSGEKSPLPPDGQMIDSGPRDAGRVDAGADAGGKDAGPPPPVCSDADFNSWQAFHLSDQLVAQIVGCSKKLGCRPGKPCALDACLRAATFLEGCASCTTAEVACVSNNCQKQCSTSDQECRACACAAGCIEQFESCTERSLEVCSSCELIAGQCGGNLLSPELIMVVVSPLVVM